jgi:hypothetical protein
MNMLCFHGYGPIAGGISEYWKVWVSGQPVFPKDIAPIMANQFLLWRGKRIYQKPGGISFFLCLLYVLYIYSGAISLQTLMKIDTLVVLYTRCLEWVSSSQILSP